MPNLPEEAPVSDDSLIRLKGEALLVAAPSEFSEACFSVPAVRALRKLKPEGQIQILCPESQLELWGSMSEVNEVISYPEKTGARKMVSLLQSKNGTFDSAILWDAGDAAKAVSQLGVAQRVGYPAKGLEKFLTDPIKRVVDSGPIKHRVRYYLGLAEELGAEAFVRSNFETEALPVRPEKLRIAVSKFSEYGDAYQWSEEKWAELKTRVAEKYADAEWLEVTNESGILSQLQSSTVLLASDGDVAHWAAHAGLPAVVVFGPGEPEWKRPLGKQSRVVREHVACSPCYLSKCPMDLRCQNEVTVEKVMRELEGALAER